MYLHLFLLLLSSGASSYFLPLKDSQHLQNRTKYAIIDEMLCLLEAEKEPINEQFFRPLHVKNKTCAHSIIKKFICELKKVPKFKCMRKVEKGMERLEKDCCIFKKSSSNDNRCLETATTDFSRFKESLEEFLKWVNDSQDCRNLTRSELGSYPDGKCSCPDRWTYS